MRTILAFAMIVVGAFYALHGAFPTLLFYLWNAYFRPEEWVWSSVILSLRLSLVLGVCVVVTTLFSKSRLFWNRRLTVVLFFVLHCGLSTWLAADRDVSWAWYEPFLRIMLISYCMVVLVDSAARLKTTLLIIALSLAAESCKQGWTSMIFEPGAPNTNSIPFLGDNNMVAVGMLMLTPVVVVLGQTATRTWARRFFGFVTIGIVYRALTTFSRGGFLACGALAGFFWLRSRRKMRILASFVLIGCIVLPLLPSAFWERMETIVTFREEEESSALSRLHLWEVAKDMAADSPWVGVGFQGYESAYDQFDPTLGLYGNERAVHSVWFGLLAELGYPGLILFLWVFAQSFRSCRRVARLAKRHPERADLQTLSRFAVALESALWSFAVGGTFLNMQYNEMLWHYLMLTICMERLAAQAANSPAAPVQRQELEAPPHKSQLEPA